MLIFNTIKYTDKINLKNKRLKILLLIYFDYICSVKLLRLNKIYYAKISIIARFITAWFTSSDETNY
ncbi:hypothetical protein CCAND93_230015 [Capnocytophaga canis]|uniref:Uncharacterized protein n=1 Tax=Capnocytophaga canis TaxID=1848903 RepID=A0A0B7IQR8_9FLAO|nr:hypothetical protein CCAND93_230015 [Capnocytophaga canis]